MDTSRRIALSDLSIFGDSSLGINKRIGYISNNTSLFLLL